MFSVHKPGFREFGRPFGSRFGRSFGAGGGSAVADPNAYPLLRDQFTDTQNPLVSGAAHPGAGKRAVTGTLLFNKNSLLRGGGQPSSPAWGGSQLLYTDNAGAGLVRSPGETFMALIAPEDIDANFAAGFRNTNVADDPRTISLGWVQENGKLEAMIPGLKVVLQAGAREIRPMMYLVLVVLNAQGGMILLSTFAADLGAGMADIIGVPQFPSARVLYFDDADTTSPVYPFLSFLGTIGYPDGHRIADLRGKQVAAWAVADSMYSFVDRITRADSASAIGNSWVAGIGTWGVSSNKIYLPSLGAAFGHAARDVVIADGIFKCNITVPTPATVGFGMVIRYQDSSNFLRFWNNGSATSITLQTWVGGSFGATIAQTGAGISWVAGTVHEFKIVCQGNKYQVFIDGVDVLGGWQTDSNSRFLTATKFGVYSNNTSGFNTTRWGNFIAEQNIITLPAELQDGTQLPIWTPGATLGSDTFTDTNGTRLNSHTPTAGAAWTEVVGTWTVSSNRAVCASGGNTNYVVQEEGTADAEVSIDITATNFNPATGELRCGIIGRYVDGNNYFLARPRMSIDQLTSDEIEFLTVINGTALVVHKVNLGDYFQPNGTVTLKVRARANLALVFLDGYPRISYEFQDGASVGTKFGLYLDSVDTSTLGMDNYTAKAQ